MHIAMIGEHRFHCFVGVPAVCVYDDFTNVEVLYGVLFGGESEVSTYGAAISAA